MEPPYPAPVTLWHDDTYDAINPQQSKLSQKGKKIVVTGAGQGIGREVVDAFARAGAEVIHLLGRNHKTLEETRDLVHESFPGTRILTYVADLVDAAALNNAATAIGRWDVLVANAGYIPTPTRIEESDPDEWWKTFEVNIKGSYLLARAFLPTRTQGGTLIAFSSGYAFLPVKLPFMKKQSSYATSKLGTARFYEYVADETPDLNVFILQPGIVKTALYEKGQLQHEDTIDTVQLPAHFCVWLATEDAKALSGRFLFANWDVGQLKSRVAPRLADDPVLLTTSLGAFPFAN